MLGDTFLSGRAVFGRWFSWTSRTSGGRREQRTSSAGPCTAPYHQANMYHTFRGTRRTGEAFSGNSRAISESGFARQTCIGRFFCKLLVRTCLLDPIASMRDLLAFYLRVALLPLLSSDCANQGSPSYAWITQVAPRAQRL